MEDHVRCLTGRLILPDEKNSLRMEVLSLVIIDRREFTARSVNAAPFCLATIGLVLYGRLQLAFFIELLGMIIKP